MDLLKPNTEDPSSKLMHYRALKIPFCVKNRYKAADIMQHIFFYKLVEATCGLATSKTYIDGPTEA